MKRTDVIVDWYMQRSRKEAQAEAEDGDEIYARYHEERRDFTLAAIAKAGGAV